MKMYAASAGKLGLVMKKTRRWFTVKREEVRSGAWHAGTA